MWAAGAAIWPLTAALAGGCDFALIPEAPPAQAGRTRCAPPSSTAARSGGATRSSRRRGRPGPARARISAEPVKHELETRLGEDTRVTILGHVQRGGTPSAFDRSMATMMGYAAAEELMSATPADGAQLIGVRRNRVRRTPLMRSVNENKAVSQLVDDGHYARAMAARGESYAELHSILRAIAHPQPHPPDQRAERIGIVHAGGGGHEHRSPRRGPPRHDRGHPCWASNAASPACGTATSASFPLRRRRGLDRPRRRRPRHPPRCHRGRAPLRLEPGHRDPTRSTPCS